MQTHDIRILQPNQYLRTFGAVLLGSLCAFQVSAQSVTVGPNGFDRFMALTTGANTQTIGFGPGGTPVLTDTFAGGSKLGNMAAFPDSTPGSKGLEFRGSGQLGVGTAGRTTPFSVVGKVPPASLTKALKAASILAGGWPGVALFAGLAVANWLDSAKLKINPDGTFEKLESNGGLQCTANCYEYRYGSHASNVWSKSPSSAMASFISNEFPTTSQTCNATTQTLTYTGEIVDAAFTVKVTRTASGGNIYCHSYASGSVTTFGNYVPSKRAIPAYNDSSEAWIPYTEEQAMIALQGTLPAAAALSDLYNKNVPIDVTNVIGKFQLTPTEQSSTKTIPGPQVVTDTPAQNGQPATTRTEQTDYNCVFVMRDVTCNEKKTITDKKTTIDPVTGLPVEETTVTTESKEAEKPAEQKDPCLEHPKRNGCREDEFDTPAGDIPKTSKIVSYAAEDLGFSGGSCPANKTMTLAGGKTITLVDWVDNCSKITTYAKPMIIAMAAFAALMIIFGGGGRSET